MKKTILVIALFTLLLALVACSGATSTGTTTGTSTSLSMEGQLLVGTLKLETTDLAMSSVQAAQLLPLWETLQSLSTSGTAATEEVQAVVDQIKSTLSAQQISSITAMKLTQPDLAAAMAENVASSSASTTAGTTNASSAQFQPGGPAGAPTGGNPAGGNPPSDLGSTDAGSVGLAPTASTQAVTSQSSGISNQIPAALINALVELLKKKAGLTLFENFAPGERSDPRRLVAKDNQIHRISKQNLNIFLVFSSYGFRYSTSKRANVLPL